MNDYKQNLLKEIGITKEVNNPLELDWFNISKNNVLTENFIREFESKMDWYLISKYQKLSEDFIREFDSKVQWIAISAFQQLTDNFIIEFKDAVHWSTYFHYQAASFDIINKFVLKSKIENISELKSSHLKIEQIQIIEKKLTLKYMFKNKIID